MTKGKLLVLEGMKGYPKESCIDYIKESILRENPEATFTFFKQPQIINEEEKREFEEIVSLMKEDPYQNVSRSLEFFVENRKKYNELISSEISLGKYVISDRYWHSNFAFQGAQGISLEEIAKANKGLALPNLTFIFEPSLIGKTGLGLPKESYKKNPNEIFKRKVEAYYRSLGYLLPSLIEDRSIKYIVADKGKAALQEQMEPMIRIYLGNRKNN